MGAISMNLPAIYVPAGPMLRGNWNGQPLGSGTDLWKYWAERCAGNITDEDWTAIEDGIARSPGFCMTMGTASTMTALAEALGMTLPGRVVDPRGRFQPCAHGDRLWQRIVEMVWEDVQAYRLLTPAAFRQRHHRRYGARRIDQRHHPPGRAGAPLRPRFRPDLFDEICARVPVLPTSVHRASS